MTSRIIRTASRILLPFILLFGIYVILYGHVSPGGGFQGGVILAMAVLLSVVIYGTNRFQKFIPYLSSVEIVGVSLFVLIGILGIGSGKQFLANLSTISLLNIVIGLKVFAGLVLMYLFLIGWEFKND
ncbi:MAG: MnhB domain-containing protein [Thermoplasmatota archaeon]|jgi:multicomponent Na+:H+ antiporter subunit B